jgi:kynureninase
LEKNNNFLRYLKGEHLLREEDILEILEKEGDQVMVALFPAIQYYTGQLLDIKKLTKAAQDKGIVVGVDLAHAVGNVPIYLHSWNVDFAAWCTYKVSHIYSYIWYHSIST